ncbi:putative quinol monooxygenase [Hymenobacter wooponensis]|uniref:Antibiotic biosynthesis monooxygenase n=1 Tax=Hymenobacter wooponensis TaxID=1525360 RepID=A0A4Z0MC22_9BACT|nr:antibiotic biosynthesis monooxygenase [Hymenobacter wooponensis]TGD77292.1 antibiotic biosynthesis monooxygenase [Hymenobacter wooponensis]
MKFPQPVLKVLLLAGVVLAVVSWSSRPVAPKPHKVRLARLVIDPTQLAHYKVLLREGVETAMQKEPGVLALYAVFEKKRPNHLTILEMYADEAAYQAHMGVVKQIGENRRLRESLYWLNSYN